MQRCSYCQFPCPDTAQKCGWCAHSLHDARREATSPYHRAATLPIAPSPIGAPRDLATLVAEHAQAATPATLTAPDALAANAPTQAAYPSWSAPPGYMPFTSAYHTGPFAAVPPPNLPPTDAASPRWWLAILPLTLLSAWLLGHNATQWNDALVIAGRVCFAGAVALVGVAAWLGYHQRQRRAAIPPLALAGILVALWGLAGMLAQPALALEARSQEASGNFVGAMQLYEQSGDEQDALRARLAWGQALTAAGNFPAAQSAIQPVIDTATGSLNADARGAMGHLLWRWGQTLYAEGNIPATRAKWSAAVSVAPGTADAAAAQAALAAPQTVTGHLTWHGEPLPGEQVALVSAWSFSSEFHILQVTGERLPATSGDTGGFSISGVRPGVMYTLIWEGQSGDITSVDASGQPTYTITLQPLAGGDLGQIAINP